ncbi:Uncharacterized protein TCM_040615 [Theobroma cacao]|uniref:Uncharacterized protein n=1 Tax=Theobroma cacao TaxID=3641 RepID=A0A061GT68_THECC|nr:Uncharacterized protein TCM_040615 [Theobroma cacao]
MKVIKRQALMVLISTFLQVTMVYNESIMNPTYTCLLHLTSVFGILICLEVTFDFSVFFLFSSPPRPFHLLKNQTIKYHYQKSQAPLGFNFSLIESKEITKQSGDVSRNVRAQTRQVVALKQLKAHVAMLASG